MLRHMTMRFLATSLLLMLVGCTGSSNVASSVATPSAVGGSPTPSASATPAPGVLVEHRCGSDGIGGGGCNAGFTLNGKHYFISCEPVSPGSVAPEAMGGGVLYGQTVTVRRVQTGTNEGQVAVGPMSYFCGPDTVAPGYYAVAPPGAPPSAG
jgi:hypothetical protein